MRPAREVFDAMPAPGRSLVAWTALMSGYATHGPAAEALELLLCMLGLLLRPDAFVFSVALRACAAVGNLCLGRQLHGAVAKLNYVGADLFVANGLVTMYSSCQSLRCAEKVFGGIAAPDLVSLTSMLSAYTENGCDAEALMLFMDMVRDGVACDAFTLSVALRAASSLGHVRLGHQLHCCMIKMGLVGNEFLDNCLIGFYGRYGELQLMPLGDAVSGMEIHSNSIRNGYGTNTSILKSLVNFYFRQGRYHQALKLCLSLSNHEISWGTLVEAFSQVDDHVGIVNLFHVIQRCEVELDHHTARLIVTSCRKLALLEEGLQAHAYMTKRGLASTACMNRHLIDMYSSCGSLRHAFDAFNYMPDKDASSWTSIIAANVENGCPETAIRLFSQMLMKEKCRPTSQAFLFALKACAESGLVSEAFRFFVSMTEVYRIQPSEGHFSHMIEVLGRAGMFKEAEHFIDSVVPSESGASARSLLCAAIQNGNEKTGACSRQASKAGSRCLSRKFFTWNLEG
ncbi:pentatricopeptide repeat-containing protein [Panicum miliaceum]|uniref:Pentatricopeptide repeat-containing protein n=1 Tax=Panicum miliaceum TaxID=4540 RepID=A0A3L6RRW7_PANMI|nr:pentatricopeptide repeat-containing protein [Panicum miliaceum]